MSFSATAAYAWIAKFEELEWSYHFDEEDGTIVSNDLGVDNRLESVKLFIIIRDGDCVLDGIFPKKVQRSRFTQVCELISYINYNTIFGKFVLNHSDGELRIRVATDFEGGILTKDMIDDALNVTISAVEKYGNAIADVMNCKSTPQVAYELANK